MSEAHSEVIEITFDQVHRLGELPHDVEVMDVVPEPRQYGSAAWRYGSRPLALYLRIEHRFCVTVFEGQTLTCTPLDKFLDRYRELTRREAAVKL